MLDIKVTDDYKLTSDGIQIIIQRRHVVDPSLAPVHKRNENAEIREEWRTFKYCGTVEQAVKVILQQNIFESDAQTLWDLREEILLFIRHVKNLLYGNELDLTKS